MVARHAMVSSQKDKFSPYIKELAKQNGKVLELYSLGFKKKVYGKKLNSTLTPIMEDLARKKGFKISHVFSTTHKVRVH